MHLGIQSLYVPFVCNSIFSTILWFAFQIIKQHLFLHTTEDQKMKDEMLFGTCCWSHWGLLYRRFHYARLTLSNRTLKGDGERHRGQTGDLTTWFAANTYKPMERRILIFDYIWFSLLCFLIVSAPSGVTNASPAIQVSSPMDLSVSAYNTSHVSTMHKGNKRDNRKGALPILAPSTSPPPSSSIPDSNPYLWSIRITLYIFPHRYIRMELVPLSF